MKILIIEDQEIHYIRLAKILDDYELDYYPQEDQFKEFAKLLALFASKEKTNEDVFKKVMDIIINYNPDFVFLDKSLNPNTKNDTKGIEILDRILDIHLGKAEVCLLTEHDLSTHESLAPENDPLRISKGAGVGLRSEIEIALIKRHNIKLKSNTKLVNKPGTITDTHATPSAPAQNKETLADDTAPSPKNADIYITDAPKTYEAFNQILVFKILPWFQSAIDYLITLSFFILIIFMFYKGGQSLYDHSAHGEFKAIVAAENAFICFLPPLIIFGFYVFYVHSLRQYVLKKTISTLDFEASGKLLTLTKKLFISSLISYLFTKIVELIESDFAKILEAKKLFSFNNKDGLDLMYKIGLISIVIVILIVFYIFLSNHKDHERPSLHKSN